jgi:outer membrane protein assembly factor BamB
MKTTIFPFILISLVLTFSYCKGPENKSNDELKSFRAGENHSGVYSSAPLTDQPNVKWKFKTGGVLQSSASISDGKVYFGSGDGSLYALDEKTGSLVWTFKTGGAIHSTPAIDNGVVYFGSYDGVFYALNKDKGTVMWVFETDGERCFAAKGLHGRKPKDSVFKDDWDFFLSSPVVKDEVVYFGTGSGYLYALNKKNGDEKWKFKTGEIIHSSPAIAYNNVYFGSWDTYLYALNAETGKEVWKFKTGEDTTYYNQTGIAGSPMIADSILYFGCRDAHLYALDAINGKLKWKRFNDYSWVSSSPIIYKDKLIYTTSDSKSLVALNKLTGDSIYQVNNAKGWILSSPSLAGNIIYFGDLLGNLNAFDADNGKKVWIYHPKESEKDIYGILNLDITLNDNIVFKKDKIEKEKKTGLEMIFTLGSINSSPVIKDKTIYVGSTNGYFYALE